MSKKCEGCLAICLVLADHEETPKVVCSILSFKCHKKADRLEKKGECVTSYHPHSMNTSDKIENLVVCQMDKNDLSIFVIDKYGNLVCEGKTLDNTG